MKEKNVGIQVNQIRELNNKQLEITISGLNSLKSSDIREIIETVFQIIKDGDCLKCPVGEPMHKRCVCFFQE
jgi:hypothetical protein